MQSKLLARLQLMKKNITLLFALFALTAAPLQAQVEVEVEDDEIIVTDEEGDVEQIDFPEAMELNPDSLLSLYSVANHLQADTDCRMSDVNPEFCRETYIDRLQRLPTIMEMSYNDIVRACIDRYTERLRRTVSIMLGAVNYYMPIFEEALETYQLPLELKYLPVIESALNPVAVSHAGATGLWQFMIATGKQYGLEVNNYVDERRDPVKASYAAARYLRDLYRIFGDWNLVIAAYNCGPENINKAIHRAGGERDYWRIYPYLPRETRGYVPAFIAANYVMNYYCEHNICPMRSELPAKTDTVVVDRNISFDNIARVCGIDVQLIRSLNPVYRRDVVSGLTTPAAIRLPLADVTRFIDLQDSIYASQPDLKRAEVEVHDAPAVASRGSRSKTRRGGSYATIRRGDTLSSIARRNGTTVAKLRKLNGIRGNNIKAGKKIRVK